MFQSAVTTANSFTFPYVGLRRRVDGRVTSSVGAFIVLNADGWIVTSGHIIDEIIASQKQREAVLAGTQVADAGATAIVRDHFEIWAVPRFEAFKPKLVYAKVNRAADLAVGRLEPFDPAVFVAAPVFLDTAADPLLQGTSVCLVGFPFHQVEAVFDEEKSSFALAPGAFPVPRFAIDGMVARFRRRSLSPTASGLFIETSSPGLRGQSGGPLLDVDGRVVGIQSHTEHLDLGFDASYHTSEGERVIERQFLNVGAASHVDEIRTMLQAEEVAFTTA